MGRIQRPGLASLLVDKLTGLLAVLIFRSKHQLRGGVHLESAAPSPPPWPGGLWRVPIGARPEGPNTQAPCPKPSGGPQANSDISTGTPTEVGGHGRTWTLGS